jgi:predicted peroxiredoxin
MLAVSTVGPDNATTAAEPFVLAEAAKHTDSGTLDVFLLQEAVYLASDRHVDLATVTAPGFDDIGTLVADARADGALGEVVVCEPCATARRIGPEDLREWATMGGPAALGRLTDAHDTTLTF